MTPRYIIRALKQFVFYITLAVLIIATTTLLETSDLESFKKLFFAANWGQLTLILAALSALYPAFGYTSRTMEIDGEKHREAILKALSMSNYKLTEQCDNKMIFRGETPGKRLRWLNEDRIEITTHANRIEISGPRKEIVTLVFRITTYTRE